MKKISLFEKKRLESELEFINHQIPEVEERVRAARELGDLSENEEYHSSKEELSMLMANKSLKEGILAESEIVEDNGSPLIGRASIVEVSIPEDPSFDKRLLVVSDTGDSTTKGVLNTATALGKKVLGVESGKFTIQAEDGSFITYLVEKQPVSRTQELIDAYPPEKEFYKKYYDGQE